MDENAPDAPRAAVDTLYQLWQRGVLGRDAAVTTLGSRGNVVVAFQNQRAYHHRVRLTNGQAGVATRNTAGDHWLAEYMFCREVERLGDPAASHKATIQVARWLGLGPNNFVVETAAM